MTTATVSQNMLALNNANTVRIERAEIKRDLKAGRISPSQVIRECENGLPLFELLCAIPRFGRVRARKFMEEARIRENVVLGGQRRDGLRPITDHERETLAALLERN
jgi:hypothetical protein